MRLQVVTIGSFPAPFGRALLEKGSRAFRLVAGGAGKTKEGSLQLESAGERQIVARVDRADGVTDGKRCHAAMVWAICSARANN